MHADARAELVVAVLDWGWPDPGELDEPFDLGNEVLLSPLPAWLRDREAISHLSLHDRDVLQRMARLALVVDPWAVARLDPGLIRPSEDRIRVTNLALWLARPSNANFDLLLRGRQDREGRWFIPSYQHPEHLRPHVNDLNTELSRDDLQAARDINIAISRLSTDSATWAALRATWRALTEPWWEERYLLLWIALEALFGPEDARETTYRLCQRLALFLEDGTRAREVFAAAKEGYACRSKIAHGLRKQRLGDQKSTALLADAEQLVRRAVLTILRSDHYTKTFGSRTEREHFLDQLAFRGV